MKNFDKLLYFIEYAIGITIVSIAVFILPWVIVGSKIGAAGIGLFGIQLIALGFLPLVSFFLVYRDAKKLKARGLPIGSTGGWAAASMLSFPIGLSIYLSVRRADWKPQLKLQQTIPNVV